MALFESYERREKQILAVLKEFSQSGSKMQNGLTQ